jgi:outer membrane protein insertion porin family
MRLLAVVMLAPIVAWAGTARAQPDPGAPPAAPTTDAPAEPTTGTPVEPTPPVPVDPTGDAPAEPSIFPVDPLDHGADFGPVLTIEAVELHGNRETADRVILAALPITVGDVVRAGDPRLATARFKVLSLGFFRDAWLSLRRGSARGQVILDVTVEERGTVVLNRLWFGTSATSPWWFGADLGQRNFLGTGIGVGGGAVFAPGRADVTGADDQWAAEARVFDGAILGTAWGAQGAFTMVNGSEPYRVAGRDDGTGHADFAAFGYRRVGGRVGATYALTPLSRVMVGGRVERVVADLPDAPTRQLPDGTLIPVRLDLDPGVSRIVTASLAYDRDTRPDPALPREGSHFAASAELGSTLLGGSYDYTTLLVRWDHWWPVARTQSIALRAAGGVVIGDAPRFDRIHVGDVDRMVTPRALGLVVAPNTSHDLLGTGTGGVQYGDVGGSAVVEWSYQLWRGRDHLYGGDLFVGGGLWGLADSRDLRLRDTSFWQALPFDLVVDAGLRIDTEVGIFELTLANALGRVPR